MSKEIITLDRIDVTFQQKKRQIQAVKDVSIRINQGDIYGIVGYSGAGKSTLVRVINLLQVPTGGTITVDNDVIFKDKRVQLSAAQLRQKRQDIGMIFQHFNLMSQLTAEENVAFALKHSGLSKEEKKEKVKKLLDLVGLADRAENYPSQLSGGQKQRVAIARALANDPKILISDEATSALDPRTTNSILELLKDINKKFGITIILITHQMEVIKKICNKAAIMSDGQIIEKGETKEIFLNPKTELAKEFVQNISHEEFRTEEEIKSREENNGKLRLSLKYNEEQVNESYITKIIRKYDVEVNILSGFIDKVGDIIVGNLLIEISANEEKAKDIIEWLKENKIDSEVV